MSTSFRLLESAYRRCPPEMALNAYPQMSATSSAICLTSQETTYGSESKKESKSDSSRATRLKKSDSGIERRWSDSISDACINQYRSKLDRIFSHSPPTERISAHRTIQVASATSSLPGRIYNCLGRFISDYGKRSCNTTLKSRRRVDQHGSRPSSPFRHLEPPPPNEVEQFPDFVLSWTNGSDNDNNIGAQDACMQHCVTHCTQNVCRINGSQNKASSIEEQKTCNCRSLDKSITESFDEEMINSMTRKDVENAKRLFERMYDDEIITINLDTAILLLGKLRDMDLVDVRFHLIHSSRFTPSTLHDRGSYLRATKDANNLFIGFRKYFETSLNLIPERAVKVRLQDLVWGLQTCMRLDVLWWISRWCLPRTMKMRDRFAISIGRANRGEYEDGIKVVFERVEELVRQTVGVLVWWHHKQHGKVSRAGSCEQTQGDSESIL